MEGLFQPLHLLVIFFIALLVFGPKKLPELGERHRRRLSGIKREYAREAARSRAALCGCLSHAGPKM